MPDPARRLSLAAVLLLLAAAAPPLRAAAADIPVHGQVVGPDGRGLAGAAVELRPVLPVFDWLVRDLEEQGEPAPLAKAVSGADGSFVVRAPAAGLGRVLVRKPGHVPMMGPLLVIHEEVRLPLLRLERDAGLRVRVQDGGGRPVAGARVVAMPGRASREAGEWGWTRFTRHGVTGADGSVTFARAEDEVLRPRVLAPLHPPQWGPEVARSSCVVKLAPGLLAAVQVLSEAGPLPDLLVRDPETGLAFDQSLRDEGGEGGEEAGAGSLLVAVPQRGRASFEILSRDGRRAPLHFGGEEKKGELSRSLALRTVRLPAAGVVVGQVIDGGTRQPVPGAYVWPYRDPGAHVRADARGQFRITGPEALQWAWVEATAPGRSRSLQPFLSAPKAGTDLPAIALEARHSLAGAVVDERGRPLAGAEVWTAKPGQSWAHSSVTDAAGRFLIPNLVEGVVDLRVTLRGFAPAVRVAAVGEKGLRVVLRPGRAAFGVVQDPAGAPIPGVQAELTANAPDQMAAARDRWRYQALTGADGRFEMTDLPAGSFRLELSGPEIAASFSPVDIPEEEERVDLGLFERARRAALTGRVVDPHGVPVAGARIWNLSGRAFRFNSAGNLAEDKKEVRSDAEGLFRLPGAGEEGTVLLEVERQGFGRVTREVSPAGKPVEIVLHPAARITGWVLEPGGRGIPGAQVEVAPFQPEAGRAPEIPRYSQARTDAEGYFEIADQAHGAFELQAMSNGYLPGEKVRLEVEAGRSYEGLEIVLSRGAIVTGRVLAENGEPLSQAIVSSPGERSAWAQTTPGGLYVLSGVDPGERLIEVEHRDFKGAEQTLEVRPGENRLDWTLVRDEPRPVRGQVLDVDGSPAAGALVSVTGRWMARTFAGPDGRFEVLLRDSVYYAFQAEKEGVRSAELRIQVAGEPVEDLELQLAAPASLSGRILGVEDPQTVSLVAVSEGQDARPARIFADGSYQIAGLTAGNWRVRAQAGTRSLVLPVTLTAEGGDTELDVEFPDPSRELLESDLILEEPKPNR